MRVVVLGLSITSSWGNGHATNYRALVRALEARGHEVLFLERDVPWYAEHRDGEVGARVELYRSLADLRRRFGGDVHAADLVLVGSFVPQGSAVGAWVTREARGVTGFYDIDTPVTLAAVEAGECDYLSRELVPRYDLYLSFTGGPTLDRLEREFGARCARAFYCLVDPELYRPVATEPRYLLGYLGTYGADRQPALDALLLEPARRLRGERFVVGGPQYPPGVDWPANVDRVEHVPPDDHPRFYCAQRVTLNVTRRAMVDAGWSPSVRLFEAAACGVPILSDRWPGLDEFFVPGEEILTADTADEASALLSGLNTDDLVQIAHRARRRVLREHTAERRVALLEGLVHERARAAA